MKHHATKAKKLWNVEQESTPTKFIARCAALTIPTVLAAVAILQGAQILACLLTILGIIFVPFLLLNAGIRKSLPNLPCWAWNRPIFLALATITALTVMTGATSCIHAYQLGKVITTPGEGEPWRKELTVKAYWHKPVSQVAYDGLADTIKVLGYQYEVAGTHDEANLHIWPASWSQLCKWPSTLAFASLDPNPSSAGSKTGDIHICRFTTPFKTHPLSDYSLVAHEAAHILAAQPHFGEGLMAEAGGNGAPWFTQEEIRAMCDKINDFHRSAEVAEQDKTGQNRPRTSGNSTGTTTCGVTTPLSQKP